MKRVLVTRPEPGASATAGRVRELGHEPVVMPLSLIVALPVSEPFPDCDAVAITSANALRHAPDTLIEHLRDKLCFCVGATTADAARTAGFSYVEQAEGDASALAARIVSARGREKIAYLAGRVRLPDFERTLKNADLTVEAIEIYDTVAQQPSLEEITLLRTGRRIDAALFYSSKAAEAFRELVTQPELAETFSKTAHCCLSERIAKRFDGMSPQYIRIAQRPDEAAILALLQD